MFFTEERTEIPQQQVRTPKKKRSQLIVNTQPINLVNLELVQQNQKNRPLNVEEMDEIMNDKCKCIIACCHL